MYNETLVKNTQEVLMMSAQNGSRCVFGSAAVEKARNTLNPLSFDQMRPQMGDIIEFPRTFNEFEDALMFRQHKNGVTFFGVMCVVHRNGKTLALPIYKTDMCRVGYNDEGEKVMSKGIVAREFAQGVTLYDAFAQFVGKSVRVVGVEAERIRTIKRGAYPNDDGHFNEYDFEFRPMKFYHKEYVAAS